uniref:Uncharacterized protein n=1 Tax=Picocystis salinarum TaxID=88271 RepID=A0A7S3UHY0_9CHLO|mmetsp:Transcript_4394/g.27991  ORF Transcript_4394/g.27991 Transcript_4394/m.27991 type:complete len:184 (+) Transcript_4394:53-604(+)
MHRRSIPSGYVLDEAHGNPYSQCYVSTVYAAPMSTEGEEGKMNGHEAKTKRKTEARRDLPERTNARLLVQQLPKVQREAERAKKELETTKRSNEVLRTKLDAAMKEVKDTKQENEKMRSRIAKLENERIGGEKFARKVLELAQIQLKHDADTVEATDENEIANVFKKQMSFKSKRLRKSKSMR